MHEIKSKGHILLWSTWAWVNITGNDTLIILFFFAALSPPSLKIRLNGGDIKNSLESFIKFYSLFLKSELFGCSLFVFLTSVYAFFLLGFMMFESYFFHFNKINCWPIYVFMMSLFFNYKSSQSLFSLKVR